nr:MAG TPA: hypothetical protein [Caudoviricetes sp.]
MRSLLWPHPSHRPPRQFMPPAGVRWRKARRLIKPLFCMPAFWSACAGNPKCTSTR